MKKTKDDKINWLKNVSEGLEILFKKESPGMQKRRLVGLKIQVDVIIKEYEDEEKTNTTIR